MGPLVPTAGDLGDSYTHFRYLYDSVVTADGAKQPVALTSDQVELWVKFQAEVSQTAWLFESYLIHNDPHPLDGQYEPNRDYRSGISFEKNGYVTWDFSKGDLKDAAKANFFCCLQIVESLEHRCSSLERRLTAQDVHFIDSLVAYFGANRKNYGVCPYLREIIHNASKSHTQIWLSHLDVAQVLSVCGCIARPKEKKDSRKNPPVKYTYRSWSEILLEQTFYLKFFYAVSNKTDVMLSSDEIFDLHAFYMVSVEENRATTDEASADLSNSPQLNAFANMVESSKINLLDPLVLPAEIAKEIWPFFEEIFHCWKLTAEESSATQHLKDLFRLYERVHFYTVVTEKASKVIESMHDLLPGLKEVSKHNGEVSRCLPGRVEDVREQVKRLWQEQNEAVKESHRLRKLVAVKDKKLEEKDALVANVRDLKGVQEEKLRGEVSRLDFELSTAKKKIEDARGAPDKVRDEFSAKVQRLHDKIAAREKTIADGVTAHESTKKELNEKKEELRKANDKIAEQEKLLKKYKSAGMKLKKEFDELKALHPAPN